MDMTMNKGNQNGKATGNKLKGKSVLSEITNLSSSQDHRSGKRSKKILKKADKMGFKKIISQQHQRRLVSVATSIWVPLQRRLSRHRLRRNADLWRQNYSEKRRYNILLVMAASAKVLTHETCTVNEDWTIVLPRRGRKGRNLPRIRTPEEQQKPWFPTELVSDPHRESKLLQKMQTCIKKLESSEFYQTFMNQIQTPEILNRFYSVLGSELKMQMVIYGIGSIESYETPRLQLSLAILMKRKLSWIGDVEVFDPILSATESQVLESFGCSVLSVNEQGRRCAIKPTLFYMPHCEAELYDNLLQANQGVMLKGIVLLGNSFETYEQHVSEYKSSVIVDTARHVLAVRKFTQEFSIKTVSDDYFAAFHDSSWHFFSPDVEAELLLTEI
ncbi:hypothetical protein LWI29_013399 [Acer saccharum]|uniref:SRR1-like domain-containing protein n=1 Tax=Acer saccharum TaxID=4024 RepID=A0AA39SJJ9_ACESA|nr:hypothetical protein LWI29_013399 [Acer saccharum]